MLGLNLRRASAGEGVSFNIPSSTILTDASLFQLAGSPVNASEYQFYLNGTIGQVGGQVALDVGQFPSGSVIFIYNNGDVLAKGGAANGGNGGDALKLDYPNQTIHLINNGSIRCGGGGGGQGGQGGQGGPGAYEGVISNVFSQGATYVERLPNDLHTYYLNGYSLNGGSGSYGTRFNEYGRGDYVFTDAYGGWEYYSLYTYGQIATAGGAGGQGGNGGVGEGYNQAAGLGQAGSAGSVGGTNAGTGGTGGSGGAGGARGVNGSTGSTGSMGAVGSTGGGLSGTVGLVGGLTGRAIIKGSASVFITNNGIIVGAIV